MFTVRQGVDKPEKSDEIVISSVLLRYSLMNGVEWSSIRIDCSGV